MLMTFEEAILFGIEQNQYPATLYKYRPNNKYTDDIFTSSALFFPTPPSFNDPFDCQIQPVEPTREDVMTWVRQQNPAASPVDILTACNRITSNLPGFRDMINESMRKFINKSGLTCFTTKHDNLLMWAHYTESHKGYCLKFDLTKDPLFFLTPLKVQYGPTYPVYNHMTDSGEIAKKVLAVKSDHWAYEEEWRVFKPGQGNQKIPFKREALTEVLFGCNMSAAEITKVKNLALASGFQHVTFSKAVVSPNSYALTFAPC